MSRTSFSIFVRRCRIRGKELRYSTRSNLHSVRRSICSAFWSMRSVRMPILAITIIVGVVKANTITNVYPVCFFVKGNSPAYGSLSDIRIGSSFTGRFWPGSFWNHLSAQSFQPPMGIPPSIPAKRATRIAARVRSRGHISSP